MMSARENTVMIAICVMLAHESTIYSLHELPYIFLNFASIKPDSGVGLLNSTKILKSAGPLLALKIVVFD